MLPRLFKVAYRFDLIERYKQMNIVLYAAFAYALTAIISFVMIAVVVLLIKVLMKFSRNEQTEGE